MTLSRAAQRLRKDVIRRTLRQFAGVEYVSSRRHDDGSITITFITHDDNADEVMDHLSDQIDECFNEGIRILVIPVEQITPFH